MDEKDKIAISKLRLFTELSSASVDAIIDCGECITLKANTYLFYEHDLADYFYIVLRGSLGVIKSSKTTKSEFKINTIFPGECVGEMAIVGLKQRTATIKSLEDVYLFRCSVKKIINLIDKNSNTKNPFHPLVVYLEKSLVDRLERMNNEHVLAMQKEINYLNERCNISVFLFWVIAIMSVFSFLTQELISLMKNIGNTTYITLPIMLVLITLVGRLAFKIGLTAENLGLTTKNWRSAVKEAVIFSIPLLALMTIIKYFLIHFVPHFSQYPLIDVIYTYEKEFGSKTKAIESSIILDTCYLFIVVPLQEFLARGVLQGGLERFLTNKNNTWYAIIGSNLVFSSFHIIISPGVALLTLIPGIYIGWLYSRNRTLIGPFVAHGLIGLWAFSIIHILVLFK